MEFALLWFAFAVLAAIIASSRGRSAFGWFLLGLLFSVLAVILVAVLPSLAAADGRPHPNTHVVCPDCKEFVLNEARKCKHCGASLVPVSAQREQERVARAARNAGKSPLKRVLDELNRPR